MESVLEINDLKVSFAAYGGTVKAVRGISFSVDSGEIVALVGESGCGKSAAAQSILKLNPTSAKIDAKVLKLGEFDVLNASAREMEQMRGSLVSMVFQDPLTCLNPTMKVGRQITEILYRKKKISLAECKKEAVKLLDMVQIPDAELRAKQYPHEFSGGMRQRVMIGMALACKPRLLIADEPTTALDVTTQIQILKLILNIQKETNTAVLLITHDFSVVANLAERVLVMYAGKIVEESDVKTLFSNPMHPYSQALLGSLPQPGVVGELMSIPGTPPDLYAPPTGCAFAKRCKKCMEICIRTEPPFYQAEEGHKAACWRLDEKFPGGNG